MQDLDDLVVWAAVELINEQDNPLHFRNMLLDGGYYGRGLFSVTRLAARYQGYQLFKVAANLRNHAQLAAIVRAGCTFSDEFLQLQPFVAQLCKFLLALRHLAPSVLLPGLGPMALR